MSDRTIGIAVVVENGTVLVGVRPPGVPLAGMHEFPGGKCLAKETAEQCAVRECEEETGLRVAVNSRLEQVEFTYDHGTLELNFFLCKRIHAENHCDEFEPLAPFQWVPIQELPLRNFPAGNDIVIELLLKQMERS